jgi:hypothetical protein
MTDLAALEEWRRSGMTYIAAVDPGRDKAGLALVRMDGQVAAQLIVPPGVVIEHLRRWQAEFGLAAVVVGDRTGSRTFRATLEEAGFGRPACPVIPVDEHRSTEEARRRYLLDHPGRGLARWLPLSLRTPDRPVDDYVAVLLAERHLRNRAGNEELRRKSSGRPE